MRFVLYVSLLGLYLLHSNVWLWEDACLIYGFPSGLLYHIALCVAASLLMILLVRFAWPSHLEVEADRSK